MDPRIKLVGVEALINSINECLKATLKVIANAIKESLTTLYSLYEKKYSSVCSTLSNSSSSSRSMDAWNILTNLGRHSGTVFSQS